jgi:hypothetical protein
MRPRDHLILGGAAAGALYPFLGVNSVIFWLASVLVDIDHYLSFLYHNGFTDFSFRRMFAYHRALHSFCKKPDFINVEIFHTVEFVAPLYAVSRYLGAGALEAVFWGILFHLALDILPLFRCGAFFKRSYSITEYLIRKRLLERRGLRPVDVYTRAVEMVRNNTVNLKS